MLLASVGMVMVCAILVTSMVGLCQWHGKIAMLRSDETQAFWLCKGQAVKSLAALQNGQTLPSDETFLYPNGTAEVSANVAQGTVSVRIVAKTPAAVSVITFLYQSSTHLVLDWKESQHI